MRRAGNFLAPLARTVVSSSSHACREARGEAQGSSSWRKRQADRCGGSTASSTRSIPARFRIRTATASATLRASARGSIISHGSASTRSGSRRSIPRRWPTSAMTSPITAASIRCSAPLADFDALIADAHARGLKVILDFVPNHTSDRHPWFLDSRASRDNPKRDWYIWRDRRPGRRRRPTTGSRISAAPAWTFDAAHRAILSTTRFCASSRISIGAIPHVRTAMHDVLRFWLDRGVDGFRVDVIWLLIKDDALRDNPPNPDWRPHGSRDRKLLPLYTADRPRSMRSSPACGTCSTNMTSAC